MDDVNKIMKSLIVGKYIHEKYTEMISNCAKKFNISKCEADILLFFYNNKKYCNAKDVVKLRHVSKSYVSKAISMLLKKGYIKIIPDDKDKRYQEIVVDDSAIKIVRYLKSIQLEFKKSLRKNINENDEKIFFKVLDQIENNILDMEEEYDKNI